MMRRQSVNLKGHIRGDEGIEFISIETSPDGGMSLGVVNYGVSGAAPFHSGLRIMFSGHECNFLESDLDQLVQEKGLSNSQRKVFEKAAPEIGKFYQKVMAWKMTRKKRILELTLQRYDIEKELEGLIKLEKECEIKII